MISRRAAVLLFGSVAIAGLVVDFVTKRLAVHYLEPHQRVPVTGDLLGLYLIRNPGAAFSIGVEFTWIFSILAVVVALGILVLVVPKVRHRLWALGLGLVMAGIVGNLLDRITQPPGIGRGHVIDFLQLPYWPIFNVADMCVVCGAILVMAVWMVAGIRYDGELEPDRIARDKRKPDKYDADKDDVLKSDVSRNDAGKSDAAENDVARQAEDS